MSRLHYQVTRTSGAPPERVFEVLYDAPGWPRWAPLIDSARWEGPDGVGRVRHAGSRGVIAREQVTVHEPPHRHGYRILGQTPARDYQALVELTASGSGTAISWTGSFEPHPPVVGHAYLLFVRWYIGRLATALAREAERTGGAGLS